MTSTELLDKNGKEIKLNHIVKIYGKFKHIFFFEGCFGYMTENSIIRNDLELDKYGTDAFVSISREKAKNMEVIGTWTGLKDKNGNLWDCDILIKSLKIAILYDGIHHNKKIYKDQNLNQIQARDKIKRSIILDNGYTYYTVKDLGKFDKKFVENQFNMFI